MRKNLFIISLLSLVGLISFSACKKNAAPSEDVLLKVETSALSLKVGEQGNIKYSVTPQGTAVSFTSNETKVATVSQQGVVTAIAEGSAMITVKAGKESKTVAVSVTSSDSPTPVVNEVALIVDKSNDDEEVVAYEAKLGRELTSLPATRIPCYRNKDLKAISVAAYGVDFGARGHGILMLGRETVKNCELTRKMLSEAGFINIKEEKIDSQEGATPVLTAQYESHPEIQLLAFDSNQFAAFTETAMQIWVIFPSVAEKLHDPVDVKDFPSIASLKSEPSAAKKSEEALGLRSLAQEENGTIVFLTKKEKISETNFNQVVYIFNPEAGPKFINSVINCITDNKDLETNQAIRTWLTTNGVSNLQFKDGWLVGTNAEGGIVQILYDGGMYFLQATAEPLNNTQRTQMGIKGIEITRKMCLRQMISPLNRQIGSIIR